jgi:hypothetical protein
VSQQKEAKASLEEEEARVRPLQNKVAAMEVREEGPQLCCTDFPVATVPLHCATVLAPRPPLSSCLCLQKAILDANRAVAEAKRALDTARKKAKAAAEIPQVREEGPKLHRCAGGGRCCCC